MIIQVDSREKARAIKKIIAEFDKQGIKYISSKLYVADYMSYDNPRLVIDRKKDLSELCTNVGSDHDRFRNELLRAQENGIKVIILCEHGGQIRTLEDVYKWQNPRKTKRKYDPEAGRWVSVKKKVISGEKLQKTLITIQERYDCKFLFCNKRETGKRIIEILSGGLDNDSSRDKTTVQND